jgi:hypothetical protein
LVLLSREEYNEKNSFWNWIKNKEWKRENKLRDSNGNMHKK